MIKEYDAVTFLEKYRETLYANEAINQLIIGNMNTVIASMRMDETLHPDLLFAVLFRDEIPKYFVCNYPPYNIVITATDPKEQDQDSADILSSELDEFLHKKGIHYPGINAPESFAYSFLRQSADSFEKDVFLGIMVATEIKDFPLQGNMRLARQGESEELSAMYVHFVQDALREIITLDEARVKIAKMFADRPEHFWVYEVDGRVVSMAACPRETELGASIGTVYTKREERGKGYCKQLMSWMSSYYLARNHSYVTLYVDMDNPCSTRAYHHVGYQVVDLSFAFRRIAF